MSATADPCIITIKPNLREAPTAISEIVVDIVASVLVDNGSLTLGQKDLGYLYLGS